MLAIYTQSAQSQVYRVTQLRTDSINCRESAGTESVQTGLKVVPVTDATFEGHHGSINVQLTLFFQLFKEKSERPRPSLFPTVVSCTSSDMPHVKEYSSQPCFTSTRSLRFQKLATSRKALLLQMLKLNNNTGRGRYVGHSRR